MPSKTRNDDEKDAKQLLDTGAEMVGGVTGAALGSLGGPPGVLGGGAGGVAVGRALKTIGGAIIRRRLEQRQENRAGAAFYVAHSRISARLMGGYAVREDGFFEPDATPMGRSPAEEILEGTLRAAANEHEERKVWFLGAFWGNLPFREDVSRSTANFLLHLAERLTWRQFVLLARAGRSTDRQAAGLLAELDRRFDDKKATDPGIASELDEMTNLGLVNRPEGRRSAGGATTKAFSPSVIGELCRGADANGAGAYALRIA